MTVIAWDGKTLAADRQCSDGGYAHSVTKIFKVPGGLVGLSGDSSHCAQLLKWFEEGRQESTWPKPTSSDDYGNALFITSKAEIHFYYGIGGGQFIVYEEQFAACGCGRDYALAAMHLGEYAIEAVQVACDLDIHCGKGIDSLTLDDEKDMGLENP